VRFVAILIVAAFLVGLMWPYLNKIKAERRPDVPVGRRRSDTFFIAFVATLIVTIVISTLLLWFGH